MRCPVRLALALAAGAAAAAAMAMLAPGAAAQLDIPPCPPGTPPLPPPTGKAVNTSGGGIVVGRPFEVSFEDPPGVVVRDIVAPPGAVVEGAGSTIDVTMPVAGPAVFTALYYQVLPAASQCLQSFAFTVQVGSGALLPPGLGVAAGPRIRTGLNFVKLAKKGATSALPVVAGLRWGCSGDTASVPVIAELRAERSLLKRPSETSPLVTLTLANPCTSAATSAPGPGALLRFAKREESIGGGGALGAEHSRKAGGRYWLRVTQGAKRLGELRYYVAFRRGTRGNPALWVIAPEAAFEAARCRRPGPNTPLGKKPFPIPACPR